MTSELHQAIAVRLKNGEGRYTRPRRDLIDALLMAGKPVTAEEILAMAPHLPLSSIYRNLAVFEETGLVHRVAGHGEFGRFELAEEFVGHHHHFACATCGAVTDVELPEGLESDLDNGLARLAAERGFQVLSHRLDVVGRCSGCAAGERARPVR
ncbi:MAG: Fur family transcriptional regulator [Candidatus Dormibacteria bacterium]